MSKKTVALIGALCIAAFVVILIINRTAPQPAISTITVAPPGDNATSPVLPKSDAGPDNATSGPNGSLPGTTPQQIGDPVQVVQDGLGGPSVVWVTGGTKNPWTPQQAVAFAQSSVSHQYENVHNLCDHTTAFDYGYLGSGEYSAASHGLSTPKSMRHAIGDGKNIPAGALVFYTGGTYGHVVLSAGNGLVYSNDILRDGHVDLVNINLFKTRWGMTFNFWTPPYFPNGFGHNPNPAPTTVVPKPAPAPQKPVVSASALATVCRYNGRNAGIPPVRRALGIKNQSTQCTPAFRARYKKFKLANYKARPQNGIPGYASLVKLNNQTGHKFTVVK